MKVKVEAGDYHFTYKPATPYRKIYSIDSPMDELMKNEKTRKIPQIGLHFIYHSNLPFFKELYTFEEQLNGPFTNLLTTNLKST